MERLNQKIDDLLSQLGISREIFLRTRVKMVILCNGILFLILIILRSWTLLALAPIMCVIGWLMPYGYLLLIKKSSAAVKVQIFPQFLRYFIALFPTNETVLQTLQQTLPFIKDIDFQKQVQLLIIKVESRADDAGEAFIEFADYIGTSEAHLVMSFLYEFDLEGINREELVMLEHIIHQLHLNNVHEVCLRKENSISKYANPPIILALFFVFTFALCVFYYYLTQQIGTI